MKIIVKFLKIIKKYMKIDLIIGILALVALTGVIYLLAIGEAAVLLMPTVTALVGFLVGDNKDKIVEKFRK